MCKHLFQKMKRNNDIIEIKKEKVSNEKNIELEMEKESKNNLIL